LFVTIAIIPPTITSDPMTMPATAPPGRPPSDISSIPKRFHKYVIYYCI